MGLKYSSSSSCDTSGAASQLYTWNTRNRNNVLGMWEIYYYERLGLWEKGNRTKFPKPRRPLNATFTKILCRLHYLTGKAQIVRHGLFTNTHGIAYAKNHFHMPTKCEAFAQTSPSFIPNIKKNYKMGVKDFYCFFLNSS